MLPNTVSAKDVVRLAFLKILKGAKWDEDKTLELVLFGIVKGHISNQVNLLENRLLQNPDDDTDVASASALDLLSLDLDTPVRLAIRAEDEDNAADLLDELDENSHEYLIVSAIFDGVMKRAEIISHAGITAQEYEAAKKRLRYFLKKFWQKRATLQQ